MSQAVFAFEEFSYDWMSDSQPTRGNTVTNKRERDVGTNPRRTLVIRGRWSHHLAL